MSSSGFADALKDDGNRKEFASVDQTSVTEADVTHTIGDKEEELLQEVMADNLQIMLAIILKIRDDPDYASSIYANCPRLQHLLEQHPDLRPVFEDQNLILINFEQVYRKAGGVLPEDKPKRLQQIFKCIVTHPLFKVLRFLLLIKKFYTCIVGGGMAMIRSILCAFCTDQAATNAADLADAHADQPDDQANEVDQGSPVNQVNREALNRAADYMEGPEVQERMTELLESDPDHINEAIEQDPELKALRDANPLCAELMNDPETMKILVDPDNLRALAECPDLIEADFADPNWSPPDVENLTFDDGAAPVDGSESAAVPPADATDAGVEYEGGDDKGFLEAYQHDVDTDQDNNSSSRQMIRGRKQRDGDQSQQGSMSGGFLSIGAGLVDYLASETVGMSASELMGRGGDDFGLSALEGGADNVGDAADSAVAESTGRLDSLAASASELGEVVASDDVADNLEDTLDKIEEEADQQGEENRDGSSAMSTAALASGAAAGGMAITSRAPGTAKGEQEEEEEEDEEEVQQAKKSGVFRAVGFVVGALGSAAKEKIATTLLGDGLGEALVEKLEKSEKGDDKDEEKKTSLRNIFGKK